MGLHHTAHYLKAQGRDKDTELVHMSPNEVKGLQALAKAHGGSLTTNPHTGLPEAGFLEDILPTVVGAGVGVATGNPWLGAAAAGAAGTFLPGGNLQKGIMAGVGAYSLGGIGADLATTGASAMAGEAGVAAGNQAVSTMATDLYGSTGPQTMAEATKAFEAGKIDPNTYRTLADNYASSYAAAPPAPTNAWDQLKAGYKATSFGPEYFKDNAFKIAGGIAAPLLASQSSSNTQVPYGNQQAPAYIRPYTYSQTRNPNFGQAGQPYFNQSYTAQSPILASQYGTTALPNAPTYMAAGGTATSDSLDFMSSGMYPQSQQDKTEYATPNQLPAGAQAVAMNAAYEAKTNPVTGDPMAHFADGGNVSQAVKDYNDMLAQRATQEYVNTPPPANLLPNGGVKPTTPVAPAETTAPTYDPGAAGLYEYYLGRKAAPSELAQWNTIDPNAMANPESAAYFNKFTSGELAKTGYKPTGPNPFDVGATAPATGATPGFVNPYTYNPATRSYAPNPALQQQAQNQVLPPPPTPYVDQGGGATGGLMPQDLRYAAGGGIGNLGGYSDGGRLLKGPGDGMSDNIPAQIGQKQPARLADGEFVVPADVVSHLGNGSTDAGAKQLYAMMDKIRSARTGKKKQAPAVKANKYLPA